MEHRVLIVAGENAEERVKKFWNGIEVPPYILYRYEDAEKLKDIKLQQLKEMRKYPDEFGVNVALIDEEIDELENETADEFFCDLTYWNEHDEDGNAISRENPEGKYLTCHVGSNFAQPFILKLPPVPDQAPVTAYTAKKKEILWEAIHKNKEMVNLFERTWEMCVEGLEPESQVDRDVYENMKNKEDYFNNFNDKEEYVASCSSFWGYAFLNEADVWVDADDCPVSQFEWMSTFYDRFIRPLKDDTRLTIFEYLTN